MNPANLVGKTIGQYQLQEVLDSSGYATTYIGVNRAAPLRQHAIRVFHYVPSAIFERINSELEKLAHLKHPHLVPIEDYGTSGEMLFLVTPLLEKSLANRFATGTQLTFPQIAQMTTEIAGALDYLQRQGIVHRAVTPNEIIFDGIGHAYLSDVAQNLILGLVSGDINADTASRFASIGAPTYMAPEAWQGKPEAASDQYSLGVVVYRLLGGRLPFEAEMPYQLMTKHMNETPTPLDELNSVLPPQVSEAVLRALAKNPADRFPTAAAFATQLVEFMPSRHETPFMSSHLRTDPLQDALKNLSANFSEAQQTAVKALLPTKDLPTVARLSRQVFISYSTRDRVLMERLAHDLETMGHAVWYDRELKNRGGQSWWDTILEHIRQAELFVFSLTPESLASEPCSREYGYAADLKKQILPVRLAPMKTDMLPPALMQIQWVDYLDAQAGQSILLESIDHLPQPAALPDPLPTPPPAPIPLINELWARGTRRDELSASEQMTLLAELEILVYEGQSLDTVRQLLTQMQNRRDVSRMAHQKIEMLLQQFFAPKPDPKPTTPPSVDEGKRGRWPFGRR